MRQGWVLSKHNRQGAKFALTFLFPGSIEIATTTKAEETTILAKEEMAPKDVVTTEADVEELTTIMPKPQNPKTPQT